MTTHTHDHPGAHDHDEGAAHDAHDHDHGRDHPHAEVGAHDRDHGHDHNDEHAHDHQHAHDHGHDHDHGHTHATGVRGFIEGLISPHSHDAADKVDAVLESSSIGIRALKISLVGLMATAVLQLVVVLLSGSVALLADTIHNFRGTRSTMREIAAMEYQIRRRLLQIGQHGFERRQIAMDVRDDRNAH